MDNRETLTPSSGDAILKRHLFSEVARNWIKGRGHIERAYFVRRPSRQSFGFRVAASSGPIPKAPGSAGGYLLYYVIASSERLADALLNGKRYCTIMNEGVRLNVKLDDRAAAIALDYVDVDRQSDRHQIEFWLVTLVRICRQLTDTRLAPRHLRIRHRRDETPAEMRSFFGCDVEFGAASDEIMFPAPEASLPMVGSYNYLNDMLCRNAQ